MPKKDTNSKICMIRICALKIFILLKTNLLLDGGIENIFFKFFVFQPIITLPFSNYYKASNNGFMSLCHK